MEGGNFQRIAFLRWIKPVRRSLVLIACEQSFLRVWWRLKQLGCTEELCTGYQQKKGTLITIFASKISALWSESYMLNLIQKCTLTYSYIVKCMCLYTMYVLTGRKLKMMHKSSWRHNTLNFSTLKVLVTGSKPALNNEWLCFSQVKCAQ